MEAEKEQPIEVSQPQSVGNPAPNGSNRGSGKQKVTIAGWLHTQIVTLFGLTIYLRKVVRINGLHFTWLVGLQCFAVKGVLRKNIEMSLYPYYNDMLGLEATITTRAKTVTISPQAMTGLFGMLSDLFPLFGYHKSSYIVVTSGLSAISLMLLAILPPNVASIVSIPMMCMFFTHVHLTVSDMLTRGKASEFLRADRQSVGETMVFDYGMMEVGKLFVAFTAASITTYAGVWVLFLFTIPIVLLCTIPTYIGWFPDPRVPPAKRNRIDKGKFKEFKRYFLVALFSAFAAIVNVVLSLTLPTEANFYFLYIRLGVVVIFIILLCYFTLRYLPNMMAKCLIFMIFKDGFYADISRLTEAWYLADSACLPNGPHFSLIYYQTYSGTIGVVFGILGFMAFQRLSSRFNYRSVFGITIGLCALGGFIDLIIIQRWNLEIGIPDKVMYILGDAMIYDFFIAMNELPGAILIARLCPPSMEATAYAMVAGFNSYGSTFAGFIGEMAGEFGDISTTGVCNFDSLPMIVVSCHMLLPLLIIPLSWFLLPKIPLSASPLDYERQMKQRKLEEKQKREAGVLPRSPSGASDDLDPRKNNTV